MKKQNYHYLLWLTPLFVVTFSITSCRPTDLPGLRELAKSEDERMTKAAQKKIETIPVFRELNQLYTKEIPIYKGFSLSSLTSSGKTNNISYRYDSNANWRDVKPFYKDYFTTHGWEITEEYDTNWGEDKVEFRKNNYRVILINMEYDKKGSFNFFQFLLSKILRRT